MIRPLLFALAATGCVVGGHEWPWLFWPAWLAMVAAGLWPVRQPHCYECSLGRGTHCEDELYRRRWL